MRFLTGGQPSNVQPVLYPGQPYLPFIFYLYLSQISKCIQMASCKCPKLLNAFLSNFQMYLSQMNQQCIQATLLFTLPLLPHSLSLSPWPSGLLNGASPSMDPHTNGHFRLWEAKIDCEKARMSASYLSENVFNLGNLSFAPHFNMYCVSHHVSGLRIWDAGIFCPFGIKSFFSLAFEQIYANIVVHGCLRLLTNVS